jgi:hypothetical protein
MSFVHIIVTIFNLNRIDEAWIEHRIPIYQDYTAQSILQQTNQNFLWINLLDHRTPPRFICRLNQIVQYKPNVIFKVLQITPIPKDKDNIWQPFVNAREFLIPFISTFATNQVITTILDNDDALCVNYVDAVQRYVYQHPESKDKRYIIDNAAQYSATPKINRVEYLKMIDRQFLSVSPTVVEPASDNPITVTHLHTVVRKYIEDIVYLPIFNLHIIHGQNESVKHLDPTKITTNKDWKFQFQHAFPFLKHRLNIK